MGGAIGESLAPVIGVALSPIPIVAVILMLFSAKAKSNGPAFVGGWIAGILIIEGLVLICADPANVSGDTGGPSTTASVIQLGLGILLLLLAAKQWKERPKGGAEPVMPKWMATKMIATMATAAATPSHTHLRASRRSDLTRNATRIITTMPVSSPSRSPMSPLPNSCVATLGALAPAASMSTAAPHLCTSAART